MLFWKMVEPLSGGACLEEADHFRVSLEMLWPAPTSCSFCFLKAAGSVLSQQPDPASMTSLRPWFFFQTRWQCLPRTIGWNKPFPPFMSFPEHIFITATGKGAMTLALSQLGRLSAGLHCIPRPTDAQVRSIKWWRICTTCRDSPAFF